MPEKKHLRDVLWLTHERFKSSVYDRTQGKIRRERSPFAASALYPLRQKSVFILSKATENKPIENASTTRRRDKTGKTYKLQSEGSFDQLNYALLAFHVRGVISN